jgi:hypothetical protein
MKGERVVILVVGEGFVAVSNWPLQVLKYWQEVQSIPIGNRLGWQ